MRGRVSSWIKVNAHARRILNEERNQACCPDAWSGYDLRSTSRSDASGSGWRPDAYVQSKNGMRTKRKVTFQLGYTVEKKFVGWRVNANRQPSFLARNTFPFSWMHRSAGCFPSDSLALADPMLPAPDGGPMPTCNPETECGRTRASASNQGNLEVIG